MKGVVYSLGCKVNSYEGQAMIASLISRGIEATDELVAADFYVINTCSVTAEADRKSRQTVARALKLNPAAKVYICGCSSQNNFLQYESKPNVRLISGTGGKIELISSIMSDIVLENSPPKSIVSSPAKEYEDNLFPQHTKTRGFIKIQDGCNNFCSYCIVPYLRGRSRSRKIESVVNEANELSKITDELVLSGINISDYNDDGKKLVDLVKALGGVSARKRFGSLECTIIDDELLAEMKKSNFCDHFHLSLQSGSQAVLKRMNRHYTPEFFLEKVGQIRSVFPLAGITTDVIAGFCDETEEEHNETKEFIKSVAFSDLHVFPYSERKGTKACNFKQIPEDVRARRASEIATIRDSLKAQFLASQIGSISEVYVEEAGEKYNHGYTSNYIKVYSHSPLKSFVSQKIIGVYMDGVIGETEK